VGLVINAATCYQAHRRCVVEFSRCEWGLFPGEPTFGPAEHACTCPYHNIGHNIISGTGPRDCRVVVVVSDPQARESFKISSCAVDLSCCFVVSHPPLRRSWGFLRHWGDVVFVYTIHRQPNPTNKEHRTMKPAELSGSLGRRRGRRHASARPVIAAKPLRMWGTWFRSSSDRDRSVLRDGTHTAQRGEMEAARSFARNR
jgi:hypothetical protein